MKNECKYLGSKMQTKKANVALVLIFCCFNFCFALYKRYSLFTINSCLFVVSYIVNSLALEMKGNIWSIDNFILFID